MIIQVVGTGSISSISNSPSYIIDNKILIDMPNGNYKNIKRLGIDPVTINHILITHFHGDHYFDMPFYLLKLVDSEKKEVFIYVNRSGIRKIKKLVKLAFLYSYYRIMINIKVIGIKKRKFNIFDYEVEKVNVDHGYLKNAYGYIIKHNNIKVGFTGDANYTERIDYLANNCDYLFCDTTFINGTDIHMGIDNLSLLASKYPKCIFVATHMSDNTRKKIKKLKFKNVIVPKDGDVIKIHD